MLHVITPASCPRRRWETGVRAQVTRFQDPCGHFSFPGLQLSPNSGLVNTDFHWIQSQPAQICGSEPTGKCVPECSLSLLLKQINFLNDSLLENQSEVGIWGVRRESQALRNCTIKFKKFLKIYLKKKQRLPSHRRFFILNPITGQMETV